MSSNEAAAPRATGQHFAGDLRRALMDAAVTELEDVGVDRLSMRNVARRIAVSHAAPAHHFTDKAGLLTAIAAEGFDLFTRHLSSVKDAASADPLDRLARLGRAYAEFADLHPAHFEVMFRPALIRAEDPEFTRAGDAAFGALRHQIEQCQEAGWRAGIDTTALTASAWSLAHGLTVLRTQGALDRHYANASLDGVVVLAAALIGPVPE